MPSWQHLHDLEKQEILSYLDERELAQVAAVSHGSRALVQDALRRRAAARTGRNDPALFLSMDAVRWALGAAPKLRILLQLAEFTPQQVTYGKQIGSGGTNTVHEVAERPGQMVIKTAGASGGFSREYDALARMETLGMRTVLRDLRFSNGQISLVMKRVEGCIDSKTIVGYKSHLKNYVKPGHDAPAPQFDDGIRITGATIQQLLEAWDIMSGNRSFFGDFQFLLDGSGEVFMNDPTGIITKSNPDEQRHDDGTFTIIQAIIDTYEFIRQPRAGARAWGAFKTWKKQLRIARKTAFGRAMKGSGIAWEEPVFVVSSFRFARFEEPARCTLFVTATPQDVAGFQRVALSGGGYGYYPDDMAMERPRSFEDWNS